MMMMMITGKVVNFRLNCGAGFFRGKPSIVIDRGHMLAVAAKYRCMDASREPPLFIIYERRRRAALRLAQSHASTLVIATAAFCVLRCAHSTGTVRRSP